MRTRLFGVVVLIVLAVGSTSCAGGPSKTTSAPAENPAQPSASLAPTASVQTAWFWTSNDKDAPLFRMVAFINNPGPKTLEGVQVEWVAYDAGGSIIGSYKATEPNVPAGGSIPYVGGAGGANLSGVPARADVRVTDPGHFIDATTTTYGVSDTQLKLESKNQYNVKAKVRTGSTEVLSKDLIADLVMKDKAGKVVGGDFWFPERLPERLPPGTAFAIEFAFVQTTAPAASAEVFVTERPQSLP